MEINLIGVCDLAAQVKRDAKSLNAQKARLDSEASILLARQSAMRTLELGREEVADGKAYVERATRAYAEQAGRLSNQASGYAWNKVKSALRTYGWQALWILLGAIVTPILHKLFAYYVIAPMSRRAAPVRLRGRAPSLLGSEDAVSVKVALDRGNELLLRSGLQSSAANIQGGDKWVLDRRMPLSCMAAGLVNLQRLRSDQPDFVVVSGTDEAHRVSTIEVPAGGAVVLQPRALLGVVKQRGQRLVVTRPWRIRWLISWITAQFRYIVFHGPCTLIVQGRSGVQIEDAGQGRMINKRLTIGFDAALAYGAARAASFLPYLRGQSSLFNDCFEGTGRYIYEQRPAGTGKGSLWGRGLKGLIDAVLSALGI